MLAELRREREHIEEAVITLERLARAAWKATWPASSPDDEYQETRTSARQQEQAEGRIGGIEVLARLFNGKECAVNLKQKEVGRQPIFTKLHR